ncbi:MAG: protein-disulfide reductase DsbD domain-containing protein, partial [Lentisphaerota bacterium]
MILCFLFMAGLAGAEPVKNSHVEAELVSDVESIRPGEPFTMALRLKMDEHWHTYWINPGDSGLGARLTWTLPEGYEAGPLQWPYPQRISTPPFMTYGYEGEVFLLTTITPPSSGVTGKEVSFKAEVSWLACKDVCMPGRASL